MRPTEIARHIVEYDPELTQSLSKFTDLIQKWNKTINLYASGEEAFWDRHIADSLQLADLAPEPFAKWVDLGSGGGLPAIVLALAFHSLEPEPSFSLIESDSRKCAFLIEARRVLGLSIDIRCARIENLPGLRADVVSARALAPLSALLGHASRHLRAGGVCIFPKGVSAAKEIDDARRTWNFDIVVHPSRTSPDGRILEVSNIARIAR